ncbi:CAP domain-containing protein [Prolixibacteraceae bacterium]|nr:CAP domain-containing protein [Prolixibacteraceae bacterium]
MKKITLLLLVSISLVTISCSKDKDLTTPVPKEKVQPTPTPKDKGGTTTGAKDKGSSTPTQSVDKKAQEEMLKEINFLRTNPRSYAEKRLKAYYNKKRDNGAYKELRNSKPVGSLKLNTQMVASAENYADVMAKQNRIGHSFGGNPGERLKKFGYKWRGCGENVACGTYSYFNIELDAKEAAIRYVIGYVIDEGVASLGHRKNLLNKAWTEVGVGFGKNGRMFFNAQQFGVR